MLYAEFMKSIVVGYDRNRAIGAGGDLPWGRDLPADLRRVRELTLGKTIVMGRKTFESISRALPGRENIVLTRSPLDVADVIAVSSLAEAYQRASKEDIVIFGGSSVYGQALPDVDVVYATEVDAEFPGADTFFPELDEGWKEIARESHVADERNLYNHDFVTYAKEITPTE